MSRRPLRPFRGAHLEELRRHHAARPQVPDVGQRTDLECAVECRGARRARRTLGWAEFRMGRVVRRGERRADRSAVAAQAAAETETTAVAVGTRTITIAEARALAAQPEGEGSRHLDRDGHALRLLGHLLLLIDTVALIVVFGFLLNLDWARPEVPDLVTVLALAVFGAAVQALLAVRLGRRLWAWRHSDPDADDRPAEFPPPVGTMVLLAVLLTVLAVFAAIALYVRVDVEAELAEAGAIGRALGLLLAASALAAPWCVVAQEAYRPAPEALARSVAGREVRRADRRRRRLVARSRRRLYAAERARGSAGVLWESARRRCQAHYLADHELILRARATVDPGRTHAVAERVGPSGTALPPWVAADLDGLTTARAHLDARVAWARAAHRMVDRDGLDLAA